MRKYLFAIVLLAYSCGSAFAGDEVDYSAPYLTLENGELVTKYPAKEHDPNVPQPQTAVADTAEPGAPTPWGIVLVVAMIALAVFLCRNDEHSRPDQERGSGS